MLRAPANERETVTLAAPAAVRVRAPRVEEARLHALGITAAWVAFVAVIDPRGELALNDDWAYVLPLQMLFEQGRLQLTFFQAMPLVGQLGWGALFCVPFGFSLMALRVSTLVLGLAGVLGTYRLLHDRGVAPALCLLAALGLLANPMYATLAHTFMTDVPFFAAFVWSACFLLRALEHAALRPLLAGMGLALFATLIRQVGVVLPLAFALAALPVFGFSRAWALRALVPLLLIAAALPLTRAVLLHSVGLPVVYDERGAELGNALQDILRGRVGAMLLPLQRALQLVLYAGLMLLPLLAALLARWLRAQRTAAPIALLSGCGLAATLPAVGLLMPWETTGNILLELAVGPRTLPGAPPLPTLLPRLSATLLAAIGAALLLFLLAPRLRELRRPGASPLALFALAGLVLGFAPFASAYGPYFDRYCLFLLPLLLLLVLSGRAPKRAPRGALAAAFGLTLAGASFSACAVHDYLAWNRARWQLASALLQEGVPAEQLEAGFEYDNYFATRDALRRGRPRTSGVVRTTARYALAFSAEPGELVLRSVPSGAWLPYAPAQVVAVERRAFAVRAR